MRTQLLPGASDAKSGIKHIKAANPRMIHPKYFEAEKKAMVKAGKAVIRAEPARKRVCVNIHRTTICPEWNSLAGGRDLFIQNQLGNGRDFKDRIPDALLVCGADPSFTLLEYKPGGLHILQLLSRSRFAAS